MIEKYVSLYLFIRHSYVNIDLSFCWYYISEVIKAKKYFSFWKNLEIK